MEQENLLKILKRYNLYELTLVNLENVKKLILREIKSNHPDSSLEKNAECMELQKDLELINNCIRETKNTNLMCIAPFGSNPVHLYEREQILKEKIKKEQERNKIVRIKKTISSSTILTIVTFIWVMPREFNANSYFMDIEFVNLITEYIKNNDILSSLLKYTYIIFVFLGLILFLHYKKIEKNIDEILVALKNEDIQAGIFNELLVKYHNNPFQKSSVSRFIRDVGEGGWPTKKYDKYICYVKDEVIDELSGFMLAKALDLKIIKMQCVLMEVRYIKA